MMEQQHHQQFQDHQQPLIVASSPSSSSCYGVSTATGHTWTPNNNIFNSRTHQLSNCNPPMMTTQDLSFHHHWANAAAAVAFNSGSHTIKQQLSPSSDYTCYPRFSEDEEVLKAAAIDMQINGDDDDDDPHHHNSQRGGRFSHIYPTINVPSLNNNNNNNPSLGNPSSLGTMNNMQALDLFNSATSRLGGTNFIHASSPSQHFGFQNYGIIHHNLPHHSTDQRPFFGNTNFDNISSAMSSSNNGSVASEPKRACNFVEPKPPQAPLKKSRLDSRASCPPFKVRKEKLGDRVAALQQLVAPFGKTDTASVLMEAIGYIKFLQNQVETLSVPYMKLLSRNKSGGRAMQGGEEEDNIGSEETRSRRRDLRSRGLCLVPLSCMAYVDDSAVGGGFWPPQSFDDGGS